jgi:SOS response regulatory protein OraA/RecX
MRIEIISVNAMSEGAEMLLTLQISDDDGHKERRKFLIFTNQYLELGLKKGTILNQDAFDAIERCSKECLAIRKGTELLSYSSSSRKRLVQRLRNKGIDRENAESAAEHLANIGAINEECDVEHQVDLCLKKLWGKKRIYRELLTKGYEKEYILLALEGITKEQMIENCTLLLQKKHKTIPEDSNVLKKIVGSLVRYGYTFDEIKCALEIVKNPKETE